MIRRVADGAPGEISVSRFSVLGIRLVLAAALLLSEVLILTVLVDTDNFSAPTGLARLAIRGAPALRMLVMAMVLTAIFGFLEIRHQWEDAPLRAGKILSPKALISNLGAVAVFGYFSLRLFSPQSPATGRDLLTILCVASGLAMLGSATLVFVPADIWRRIFRAAPLAPVFGATITVAIAALTAAGKPVWAPWMRLTYRVVVGGLHLVRSNIVTDPASFLLGTNRFTVVISPECSGYEGMALMLVFGSAWLWFFRREFRFPQALLLLPIGTVGIWILNCARILALILIGDAGAPAVAAGGFHSEAGWIAFIVLAAGLLLATQRVSWFSAAPISPAGASQPYWNANTPAPFLVPFLSILAAGMVAHAATANFEWLYPLRVLGAISALWYFRRAYAGMKWRIGWESIVIGCAVFVIWIGAEHLPGTQRVAAGMPAELAGAAPLARWTWLAFRVCGAVLTVPVAEELVFRGYALRRLQSADFTAVDLRFFKLMPLAVSSLLFGILHGQRWLAGTLAGAMYAAAVRKRGSLGDAAAAHAVTNALLAAWVLYTGSWQLW